MMESFTWGSDEGMQALTTKQADTFTNMHDENWSLTPNPKDFNTLISALRYTAEHAAELGNLAMAEQSADFLSSIAESLGVEFI